MHEAFKEDLLLHGPNMLLNSISGRITNIEESGTPAAPEKHMSSLKNQEESIENG